MNDAKSSPAPRLIAHYLPQFHPVPENDAWWGQGFTEWTNVTRSQALFAGHTQPHLPTDLGFYDLRVPEVREAQAELARQYGIHGFMYYHYWFHGKRLLERPFDEVLRSGKPDFPFCLCWANESWSRRWLGEERDVLVKQTYSKEDDVKHAAWLTRAFEDPRYIRVGRRPVFLVYRPLDLPDPVGFVDRLRESCEKANVDSPFLIGVNAHNWSYDHREMKFDANLGFEPQLGASGAGVFTDRVSFSKLLRNIRLGVWNAKLKLFDDNECRKSMLAIKRPGNTISCCYVGWDNSPRRGKNGIVYVNGTPDNFRAALLERMQRAMDLPEAQRFVFINAWNEWAEGNHLEPDATTGHEFLKQIPLAREQFATETRLPPQSTH